MNTTRLKEKDISTFLSPDLSGESCEVCGSSVLSNLFPTEMMHGDDGPFQYFFCHFCETTYQPNRLDDYSRYYPASYYSFQFREPESFFERIRQIKRRLRNKYYYFSKGIVERFLASARPRPVSHLGNHIQLRQDMAILEVGCGAGELLHEIADLGVRKVIGIDPFVPGNIAFRNGAKVYQSGIQELADHVDDEKFDLIMFNHSLEHSPTPFEDVKNASKYLKMDGEILIRTPVSGSDISNTYGKYWWGLDAPRHIYLFSTKSISLLAKKCAMSIKRTHFEGTIDDFLASEQHKMGIPLLAENSYVVSKSFSGFSATKIKEYEARIAQQNEHGRAAMAGFILGF